MYIRLTGFLETGVPEVVFDTNRRILEGLVIVERICAKLIFGRCISLDWDDHRELKAAYTANYKHNMIKAKKENLKARAKRIKNEKQ